MIDVHYLLDFHLGRMAILVTAQAACVGFVQFGRSLRLSHQLCTVMKREIHWQGVCVTLNQKCCTEGRSQIEPD